MKTELIGAYIGALKHEQAEIAEAAMLRPKKELFELGESAGRYQGLERALEILEDILSDEREKERKS